MDNNGHSETKLEKGKVKKSKPRKKRISDPSTWKVNVRKTAIQHGESYTRKDGTVILAKTVGEYCENCRIKCPTRISQDIRQQFFDRYYNISSLSEKRQFLLRYVQTVDVKRHKGPDSNRKLSRTFYIGTGCWENGIEPRIQVCKVTFLNTLGISDNVLRAAYARLRSSNGTSFEDLRGRFIRTSEDSTEQQIALVKDHIKTFPLVDNFMPRIYDLYCDYMRKQSAKPHLFVSIETYKTIYDKEFELKLLGPTKKKKGDSKKSKKVITKQDPLEIQSTWDQKPQNTEMTLEQYNAAAGQHSCYEKAWMGMSATETKVGYVNYQIPTVKIEVDHEPQQQHQTKPSFSNDKPLKKATKTVKSEVKSSNDDSKKPLKKSHSKKSLSDPSKWAANIRKNANLHGLSYKKSDGTIVPAKCMKEICRNCRMNCESKFDDNLRQQFFDRYYRLTSINEKYQFILRYTQNVDVKNHKTDNSRRKISRLYFVGTGFWDNGSESRIQVCQTTFLNTLSISGKTVRTAYDKLLSTNGTSFEDLRGSYNRKLDNTKKIERKKKRNPKNDMTEEDFSTANILANM